MIAKPDSSVGARVGGSGSAPLQEVRSAGGFFRNVAILGSGTVIAQLIPVLLLPILVRLYTPSEYGVFSAFTSAAGLLVILVTMQYHLAIPLPKQDGQGVNMLSLVILTSIGLAALSSFILLLLKYWDMRWVSQSFLGENIQFLGIAGCLMGIYTGIQYWSTRKAQFSCLSYSRILQASGQGIAQVGAGLLHAGPTGLIIGFLSGQVLGIISLLSVLPKGLGVVRPRRIYSLARRYRRFPGIFMWAEFLNAAGNSLLVLSMATFMADQVAGHVALMARILSLPTVLIGAAVARVFFSSAAEKNRRGESFTSLIHGIASFMVIVAAPMFLVVTIWGPDLFSMVFGNAWRTSGVYGQLLTTWLLFQLISSPLSVMAIIKEKQRQVLIFTILYFGIRSIALWTGISEGSAELAVGLFSLSGALVLLGYIIWIFYISDARFFQWLASMGRYVFLLVTLTVVLLTIREAVAPLISLAIGIVLAAAFTVITARRFTRDKSLD